MVFGKKKKNKKSAVRAETAARTYDSNVRETLNTTREAHKQFHPPQAREPLRSDENITMAKVLYEVTVAQFNRLSDDSKRARIIALLDGYSGLGNEQKRWIKELYNPNTEYDMENEVMKLQRKTWDSEIILYMATTSSTFSKMSDALREEVCWKCRNDALQHQDDLAEYISLLDNGNIAMDDDTKKWVVNLGQLAIPGLTRSFEVLHYATEKDKNYVEKDVMINGRNVKNHNHRMNRRSSKTKKESPSLGTMYGSAINHAELHTAAVNEEEPPTWNKNVDNDKYRHVTHQVDMEGINLNLPTNGLKENGKTISGEEQLKRQKIAFAHAAEFQGTSFLKKEDLCKFLNLSTIVTNIQIIHASTRRPAVVVAVGIYAKKLFQGGGEDAFWTTSKNMYYVGWVYHPQSMNGVCVTDLVLLRRSDRVMAIFLTLGVFLRPVVYFYAEKRCTDTFDPVELERINALIGKQRDNVRTVWVELKVWKKELPDGDVLDIEAFKVAVRTRHPDISEGAFTFVFGGEKHRNDVITISAELKDVREDLLAGTLSFDAFKAAVHSNAGNANTPNNYEIDETK